jgi:hypothetical protein
MIKAHNVERFKRVLNNTIGILFLATPHRGSNLARTLANILKATFSERRFVGDLQLGSQTVDKINELFAERADGMALISFWESTDTRFVGVCPNFHVSDLCAIDRSGKIFRNIGIQR